MVTARPSVLLLTPVFHDERIWGRFARDLASRVDLTVVAWPGHGTGGQATDGGLDRNEQADRLVAGFGDPDLVVAAAEDVGAAVHLGLGGHTRAIALIAPVGVPLEEVPIDDFGERLARNLERVPDALMDAWANRDAVTFADQMATVAGPGVTPESARLIRDVVSANAGLFFEHPEYANTDQQWAADLAALTVPVLVIAAARRGDDLQRRMVHALVDRCRDGTYAEVDAETDYPWLEKPDDLLRALLDFIDSGLPGPAAPGTRR